MGHESIEYEAAKTTTVEANIASQMSIQMTRREFLPWLGKKTLQVALLPTIAASLEAYQRPSEVAVDPFQETSIVAELRSKERVENGEWITVTGEYKLTGSNCYIKTPALFDGKVFDISRKQYLDKPLPDSVLLSNTDVFANREYFSSRNMLATPELMLQNPVFLSILARTEELRNELQTTLGGQFNQFILPLALSTALREKLVYKKEKPTKPAFSNLSLSERLSIDATNCQEFTAITAYALACYGIPSDIIGYSYTVPEYEIVTSEGTKIIPAENKAHVCNVINIMGTCCVIDTTTSEYIHTLSEYLNKRNKETSVRNSEIFYDSFFPNKEMPWDNPKWIGKENSLVNQGSMFVAQTIANLIKTQRIPEGENRSIALQKASRKMQYGATN